MENFNIIGICFLLLGLSGSVAAAPFAASDALPITSLAPMVRSSALPPAAPRSLAARMLALPLVVVGEASHENAPRVVVGPDGRRYYGAGDQIHVQGELQGGAEFPIVRVGRCLVDPLSQEYLGDEFIDIGTATLLASAGNRHRLLILDARQEIRADDRLLALSRTGPEAITPYSSTLPDEAVIVSVYDGAVHAAQNQIVVINKGARDQLREGAELRLYASAEPTRQVKPAAAASQFPEEERGRLLIFRVFERVSYGLITQASEPLQVGDKARAPP